MTNSDVELRLDALDQLIELGQDHLPSAVTDECVVLARRSHDRLRHGTAHTVVAIAGSTGSGKSSLMNAIVGAEVSTTGVRRPTTAQTHAVIWGGGADALLDWLAVQHRHHVHDRHVDNRRGAHESEAGAAFDGLVLLDLPDHDSIEHANRAEVDRLVGLVDLFIWVADPQKYADQSLHEGYLRRLADHGDVMRFVLTKSDTLTPEAAGHCRNDFEQLIIADGIPSPTVLAASSLTGEGLAEIRGELADVVAEKAAVVDRIDADLVRLGRELAPAESESSAPPGPSADRDLVSGLTDAADADGAGSAVASHHRHVGAVALGWPMTRWLRRFRKSPINELPTLANSPTMTSQVHSVLRDYGDAMSTDLGGTWRQAVRGSATDEAEAIIGRLDRVGAQAFRSTHDRPRWWTVAAAAQWAAAVTAVAGLVWLLLLVLVDNFLRIDVSAITPDYRGAPLPTWLLLGGLIGGLILTNLLRIPLAIGAKRRARAVRSEVEEQVATIAGETAIASVRARRDSATEFAKLASIVANGDRGVQGS